MKEFINHLIAEDTKHYKYWKLNRDVVKMEFYDGRLSALQDVLEELDRQELIK